MSADHAPTIRVLALHLTRTSSSEAKVLGAVLRHLTDEVHVDLVLNVAARGDDGSYFTPLLSRRSVDVHWVDVGLPADPRAPRPLWRRVLGRAVHRLRRGRVARLARSLRPDVVYTSQQRFDVRIGELASRDLDKPIVVHLHYTPGPALRDTTLDTLRGADHVVAISRFIRDRAVEAGVDAARITVVPNALELPAPRALPPAGERRVVTVGQTGRIEPEKGFVDSVVAFSIVHRAHPEARLVLVGDGSDRSAVERAAIQHGAREAIELPGWRADVASYLDDMDIFIHPSRDEPFGMAVLEAMALGLPILAYRDGATEELVLDGTTGVLVAPGDVRALADALAELVTDAARRERLGAAGRDRVAAEFSPAQAGERVSALLVAAARGRSRPRTRR